jgi:hypothetical protein
MAFRHSLIFQLIFRFRRRHFAISLMRFAAFTPRHEIEFLHYAFPAALPAPFDIMPDIIFSRQLLRAAFMIFSADADSSLLRAMPPFRRPGRRLFSLAAAAAFRQR